MALIKLQPYTLDETKDFTFNNVTATGNLISVNANLGNLVTANFFSGNGSLLTGLVSSATKISNGTSNIDIVTANGNITMGVNGIGNIVIVTGTGINVSGIINSTGNLTALNANLGNLVTANFFTGNGSSLTDITGANVTGQVANAAIAGTVYTAAQPNITSVGTLTSLTVTGNVSGNFFIGNGSQLTGITSSSSTAVTVTGNAQPNITSVGSLTSLVVTGNITSGNANLGNLVTANLFTGTLTTNAQPNITSVGTLTVLTVSSGNLTANTGNVIFGNVGNVRITGGVANYVLSTDGTGNLDWVAQSGGGGTSNIQILDEGSILTNAVSSINFTGSGVTASNTGNAVTVTISGGGGGSSISNGNSNVDIQANANVNISVSGTPNIVVVTSSGAIIVGNLSVGNANLGNLATANFFTGTLTTNAQPNITSVGTLASLAVSGNITAANITANTGVFTGNGSGLSAIAGANVTGTVANATFATSSGTAGTVTTNAQPNITSTGTLSNLVVNGNVVIGGGSGGNIANANVISANTFIGNGSQLTGVIAVTAGTVTTAAQPNITSVGTLTSLDVSGNITAANITANTGVFTGNGSGLSSLTFGNISNFSTAGLTVDELYSQGITRLDVTASGASGYLFDQYGATLNPALYVSSGQTIAFLLSVSGHPFLIRDPSSANYSVGLSHVTSNGTVTTTTSAQGQVAGTLYWKVPYGITGNYKYQCSIHGGMNGNIVISDANVSNHSVSTAATVTTNAQPNITSVGTLTVLTVSSGNLTANTGNVIFGNVGNVRITGGVANYVLKTDGTGNLDWVAQSGGGSANIQILDEGIILTNSVTSINFTGAGVTASNTGNAVTVDITSGGGGGSSISNGTSNVSIVTANGNIGMSVGGVINVLVASQTGIAVSGISNLGNVGNVRITGGVANYVLSTDGAGILNWVAQSGGGGSANIQILDEGSILTNSVSSINFVGPGVVASNTGNAVTVTISGSGSAIDAITLDSYTGNGVQTNFTLSVTPQSENFTSVNIGGVSQLKTDYSLSGNILILSSPPAVNASIEVTTITLGGGITAQDLLSPFLLMGA